jgi:hypothetical protein
MSSTETTTTTKSNYYLRALACWWRWRWRWVAEHDDLAKGKENAKGAHPQLLTEEVSVRRSGFWVGR